MKILPHIQDKFMGVYFALAWAFISIIAGISTVSEDGYLRYTQDSFITGAITLIGIGAYVLRKRRHFGRTFTGSRILELILLAPLVTYFIWYIFVHGNEWFNDPFPLIIISTVWSLISYFAISLISGKSRIL